MEESDCHNGEEIQALLHIDARKWLTKIAIDLELENELFLETGKKVWKKNFYTTLVSRIEAH